MKIKQLLFLSALSAVVLLSSCGQKMTGSSKLNNKIDSLSYMLGADVGENLRKSSFEEINYETFLKGVMDSFKEKDLLVNAEEIRPYISKYVTELRVKKSKVNLEEGIAFLEENKTREGVITTESGLQYEIITEGTGESPKATDVVNCHYHGTMLDGTVFDSSVDRGAPIDFGLNKVITGWTEGVQLMKVGAKYKFYIPSDLAYGPRGSRTIEPNSTLIFEVELLEVKGPAPTTK